MSTNPNKLAFKGTPGPWKYTNDGILHGITPDKSNRIIGYFGSMAGRLSKENEANSYIASAAPEAVEFIADLLEAYDGGVPTSEFFTRFLPKAEEILKKAYNY